MTSQLIHFVFFSNFAHIESRNTKFYSSEDTVTSQLRMRYLVVSCMQTLSYLVEKILIQCVFQTYYRNSSFLITDQMIHTIIQNIIKESLWACSQYPTCTHLHSFESHQSYNRKNASLNKLLSNQINSTLILIATTLSQKFEWNPWKNRGNILAISINN